MMTTVVAEHELFASCRVLFGTELDITRNFLEYLQRSGIKSAYRKKALETHPDMLASQGGGTQAASVDLFRRVQQSYENLSAYLDARDNGFHFPPRKPQYQATSPKPEPAPPRPEKRWSAADAGQAKPKTSTKPGGFARPTARSSSAWCASEPKSPGAIPSRKLLFGHYLYYAGFASWHTIIKALVWQRTGRPRLGEIGRRFGWLTEQEILKVLQQRKLTESFGASAVALGFLTERQLRLMIFQQNKLQKRFGQYFILHNLLTPTQIEELARHCLLHNTTVDRRRSFAAGGRRGY